MVKIITAKIRTINIK